MTRSPSRFLRHDSLDSGQLLGGHRENRTTANDAVCCLAVRADLRLDYEHPLGSLTLPQCRHGRQFHLGQLHIAIKMEHGTPFPTSSVVAGWSNAAMSGTKKADQDGSLFGKFD